MEPKKSFLESLLHILVRNRKSEKIEKIDSIARSFSITEKTIFLICMALFAGSTLSILGKISDVFSIDVPLHGGSLIEGEIGTPRFINPLLAVSDTDRDLTQLVFSGLMKTNTDGSLVPDLAETYSVSADGLTYSFTIKKDVVWSDGLPVTADDVKYTIDKAQDPALKSPRFVNWQGVSVEKTGIKNIVFHLKQPYAPFINNLTLGIMPAHLWKNVTTDQMAFSSLNTNAIGSGPFIISLITKNSEGIPTEVFLKSNPKYALGEPYISNLAIKYFAAESDMINALHAGHIDSASNISPATAKSLSQSFHIISAPLTRIFGVFFNQNQNEVLAHKEVRQALNLATNKDSLINTVIAGYGTAIDGPLPPTTTEKIQAENGLANETASSRALEASTTLAEADKLLTKAGWKKNPLTGIYEIKAKTKGAATTTLSITISTANIPELVMSAKKLSESWTSFGINTLVSVFEPSDLNQSVIRPRKYDSLLFGLVTGKTGDLYPFWHSSQRNDPGLNIALYTNRKADQALEKMRLATSSEAYSTQYALFKNEIDNDTPAVFLWSPDFLYVAPAKLHGVTFGEITASSDRFLGVEKWYIDTDHIWKIFVKDKDTIIEK